MILNDMHLLHPEKAEKRQVRCQMLKIFRIGVNKLPNFRSIYQAKYMSVLRLGSQEMYRFRLPEASNPRAHQGPHTSCQVRF